MKTQLPMFVLGLVVVTACAARAQESPAVVTLPAVQSAPPAQTPPPPQTQPVQAPPAQTTPVVESMPSIPAAPSAAVVPPVPTLSPEEIRQRRGAIFLMEGVFVNAVRLAAAYTADQLQAVEPAPMIFTSAPARAHGSYLEGYGVFFHVEIPSVNPTVASLMETIQRERQRQSNPAQQTSLAGGTTARVNPDAHYVESVRRQLVTAMLDHSKALDLRPGEWLTVEAREAQEIPGQIAQPSTLVLRVRGADLNEFLGGRLSRDEVLKRVQVRPF